MKHPPPKATVCACANHAFAVIDHKTGDGLHVAIVSPQDAPLLEAYRWRSYCPHFKLSRDHRKDVYYLRRDIGSRKTKKTILFHREVLGVEGRHVIVDHWNHNGLDCRRPNLRSGSQGQNRGNGRMQINNMSGYKGVSLHRQTGKWRVAVGGKGYIGLFACKHTAARAYNEAAQKRYGGFAKLNVIHQEAAE